MSYPNDAEKSAAKVRKKNESNKKISNKIVTNIKITKMMYPPVRTSMRIQDVGPTGEPGSKSVALTLRTGHDVVAITSRD